MLIQIQLHLGTSGEFIIEIDATGTETLLTYDTKITFTNKPANLKFYEDIEKTQELIVENDKYLALNGFMSLDDNKKRDIPIYWDWKFETGESEMDREENDIIDSEFMGKVMSMQIDVNGTQVTSNPYEEGVAFSTINGKIINFSSAQEAIDFVGENKGAIVSLIKDVDGEKISVANGQDIVFNTNDKKITSDGTTITNYGKMKIVGNGVIDSTAEVKWGAGTVVNNGELEFAGSKVTSTNAGIVNNSTGVVTISGGNIKVSQNGILNYGNSSDENNPALKIKAGNIEAGTGNYGIYTSYNGTIIINGGIIKRKRWN